MLRLDPQKEPAWLDLGHGVRLLVAPLTTSVMLAARSDPAIAAAAEAGAGDDALAQIVAQALARIVVSDWDGVGDADGDPLPVSPEGIDALLDIWPIFEAFQTEYVAGGLILEQEKNASPLSPTGTSAGAEITAQAANKMLQNPATTARRG